MADLQARIDELEAQNAMAQQPQQPDQMEMLERSYQLAAHAEDKPQTAEE